MPRWAWASLGDRNGHTAQRIDDTVQIRPGRPTQRSRSRLDNAIVSTFVGVARPAERRQMGWDGSTAESSWTPCPRTQTAGQGVRRAYHRGRP